MESFERRTTPDGIAWLISNPLRGRGVIAAFTERTGGESAAPFGSLNLGFKEGDLPDAVRRNRELVVEALGCPPFATAQQVHGSLVGDVGPAQAGQGFHDLEGLEGCDALVTSEREVPLAILTADCVPIAMTDGRRVAAVHAGWKGLRARVLAVALTHFPDPSEVTAAIGPAIGPCHYEVGEEVVRQVAHGVRGEAVAERRDGSWFLDLAATAAGVLRARGVEDVHGTGLCTACEAGRFFSYRRDGRTGRQAMVAMRR
jgi:YfiH family protein